MPGSQNESPSAKRTYGKDTLRPVTIKQLIEAHHPNPDADYIIIDGSETTQIKIVGQIRNISQQTTNVTYKLDDGTGIVEVKQWIDAEALSNPDDPVNQRPKLTEHAYARVYGRLKIFNNKRHVGAMIIRPIQDYNEIQYHLLEATAVHLHFTKGPLESMQAKFGANGAVNGGQQQQQQEQNGGFRMPAGISASARKVLKCIAETPQTNEGMHMQDIASRTGMDVGEVLRGGEELLGLGTIFTTYDDHTWALLQMD